MTSRPNALPDDWEPAPVRRRFANACVREAVTRGWLDSATKRECADCGLPAHEYHHEDYSRPMDVVALCKACHLARHSRGDYGR